MKLIKNQHADIVIVPLYSSRAFIYINKAGDDIVLGIEDTWDDIHCQARLNRDDVAILRDKLTETMKLK